MSYRREKLLQGLDIAGGADLLATAEGRAAARLRQAETRISAPTTGLARAEDQIEALKQSRSWRITAPLLGIGTVLGRR